MIFKHKHSIFESQRRAKNMIYDLARANDWEWFFTFTFNPEKVDSYDYFAVSALMSKWLENVRHRYAPDMKYIVVPEYHKSGRFHFHGMFSNIGTLKLVDSGHKTKDGMTIYNVGSFRSGFTTATKIKSSTSTALYIGKYITKDLSAEVKGRKRYWRSKNLNEPIITKSEIDFRDKNILELESSCVYKKEVVQHFGSFERRVTYYEFRE